MFDPGAVVEFEAAELLASCTARLREKEIYLQPSQDFERVKAFAEAIDKGSLTPYLDPDQNDFSTKNGLWMLALHHEDPIGMIGCRKDFIDASLKRYSEKKLRQLFPSAHNIEVRPDRLPSLAEDISGEVVYLGDMHFADGRSRDLKHRDVLRDFITALYCLIALRWPDLDWLYAFIRNDDARRSGSWIYQPRHQSAFAHSWTQDPSVDEHPHWLLASERRDLHDLILGEARRLNRDGVIKYARLP